MNRPKRVVVIGAGISGLTTAWWLHRSGLEVTVLEREASAGGTMRTMCDNGWLVETGPTSALETTPLFNELFEELGITKERVYANDSSKKRYILRGGELHELPMSPSTFLATSLWSMGGKLRLLKEPFIGRANKEETIAEFVERRLGREFLDYAINPFVAGVYAGNPEQLSVRAAFPKLYALEEKYGGLIKGMIQGRKERKHRDEKAKDRARMFSFVNGMQALPDAIVSQMKDDVRLRCDVTAVSSIGEGTFRVEFHEGGSKRTLDADAVVFAIPSYVASTLVRPSSKKLAELLDGIYYPPVAEVFLGFRVDQIKRPLDGFGFLVPAKERRKILGTIWSSSIFPARAPEGLVALTTFVGGSRQPELVQHDDKNLLSLVTSELQSIMNMTGSPAYTRIFRWAKAIPQYNLGYQKVLDEIERFEDDTPGLFFCANYRGGIAVGDCVMSGKRIAERIVSIDKTKPTRGLTPPAFVNPQRRAGVSGREYGAMAT